MNDMLELCCLCSREEKYKAKLTIDVIVQRLGDTLAAALFEMLDVMRLRLGQGAWRWQGGLLRFLGNLGADVGRRQAAGFDWWLHINRWGAWAAEAQGL